MRKTSVKDNNNIKLNMSRRIRRTPYTNKVEKLGVSDFTVVNHMLLPKGFRKTIEEDYWHLNRDVQLWDVSCQRQVQIKGKDAFKLVQKLTPRPLKNMETGKLYVKLKAYDSAIVSYQIVVSEYYDTKFFKDANMEIIRCLALQNKKDEAEQFLTNLELNEKSVVTNAFKDEALSVIKDNS